MKIRNVEKIVREVLETEPDTRSDDFKLIVSVYYKINPETTNMNFGQVMYLHQEMGLPYFESVRRARCKLQAENEDLRPDDDTRRARMEKETEYYEYALGGK